MMLRYPGIMDINMGMGMGTDMGKGMDRGTMWMINREKSSVFSLQIVPSPYVPSPQKNLGGTTKINGST